MLDSSLLASFSTVNSLAGISCLHPKQCLVQIPRLRGRVCHPRYLTATPRAGEPSTEETSSGVDLVEQCND